LQTVTQYVHGTSRATGRQTVTVRVRGSGRQTVTVQVYCS
jgi:hypothetical protein